MSDERAENMMANHEIERIMKLPAGADLDAEVARRLLGWTTWNSPCVGSLDPPDCWITGNEENPTYRISGFRPSNDETLCRKFVMNEIERRNASDRFMDALCEIVGLFPPDWGVFETWQLVNASAADKCRAALVAALSSSWKRKE